MHKDSAQRDGVLFAVRLHPAEVGQSFRKHDANSEPTHCDDHAASEKVRREEGLVEERQGKHQQEWRECKTQPEPHRNMWRDE
jgi:hypothetical protein